MVPTIFDEWTLKTVIGLVSSRAFETDSFDFKERLPDSRDNNDKVKLATDCAAFANAAGGFLVFGVKDDRSLAPDMRLVGLDLHLDFPEQFGNFPARCSPTVPWDFKSLALPNDKLLHVVQIQKSWRAPHCVSLDDISFRFPKRTNKGNEYMPISEVQAMFLGHMEKRRKLDMLQAELTFIDDLVKSIRPNNVDADETTTLSPPIEVLQVLIGETYVLLEQDPVLLAALNKVRRLALDIREDHADYERKLMEPNAHVSLAESLKSKARNHNALVQRHCDWLIDAIKAAQKQLRILLG